MYKAEDYLNADKITELKAAGAKYAAINKDTNSILAFKEGQYKDGLLRVCEGLAVRKRDYIYLEI